jgi:hypothetical protein
MTPLTETERAFIFMVHEVNRQLGAVDDAIVRGNLAAAQSLTRHLILRTGTLLDNLKTMDLAEALKDAH